MTLQEDCISKDNSPLYIKLGFVYPLLRYPFTVYMLFIYYIK